MKTGGRKARRLNNHGSNDLPTAIIAKSKPQYRSRIMSARMTSLFAGLTASLLLLSEPCKLHAATIPVTNTDDSGPGSLRDALAGAADGDTIQISATGFISLAGGELYVPTGVSIIGPGRFQLFVSGGFFTRVFR